jgi:hypothetical protein
MIYLVVPLVLAVLAGLVRGGDLRRLAQVEVRHGWLPLAMFALQFALVLFPQTEEARLLGLRPAVMIASYGLLLAFLWANRGLSGMKLILLGAALNLAVIAANGGYMPVTRAALERSGHLDLVVQRGGQDFVLGSKDIVLPAEQTRLQPLSDVVSTPAVFPVSATFSFGDLFIMAGAAGLAYGLMFTGEWDGSRRGRGVDRKQARPVEMPGA